MFFSATNQLNALQPLETKRYSKYSKITLHATQLLCKQTTGFTLVLIKQLVIQNLFQITTIL